MMAPIHPAAHPVHRTRAITHSADIGQPIGPLRGHHIDSGGMQPRRAALTAPFDARGRGTGPMTVSSSTTTAAETRRILAFRHVRGEMHEQPDVLARLSRHVEHFARQVDALAAAHGGFRDVVFLAPARGEDLRVGEIAVFRGHNYLTIHRLVFRERGAAGEALVFRGDYNRQRERVDPSAVIARVVAIEVPGRKRGTGKVVAIEPDILARFYRLSQIAASLLRPVLPPTGPGAPPPGRLGRAARSLFSFTERFLSVFLPERR